MAKTGQQSEDKGKVYVTIHKLGSDEQVTFQDGDTIEHLIKAVSLSDDLQLRISGKDVSEFDRKSTLGSMKDKRGRMEVDAAPRRGSHG